MAGDDTVILGVWELSDRYGAQQQRGQKYQTGIEICLAEWKGSRHHNSTGSQRS